MAYIVTARKYRPQQFSEVVGQEHITTTLKNALSSGRIAHAYLFTGPRGVGKTTTARILAKALNCLDLQEGAEPCNNCDSCRAIQNSQLMDIIEIDAASNRGIDEVRSLRESVKYAPTKGKYKVYIIDEVHMLTKDSFNAFLKTLEEPPSHTVFIFATTDVHRVPVTIISRCQRYDFRRIQLDTIKNLLKEIAEKESITVDDRTLTLIAKRADGGLRDAESFFDQAAAFCGNTINLDEIIKVFNFIDDGIYFRVSDALLEKQFKTAFDVALEVYENGWSFIDFMQGLIEHFRNIMTVAATGKTDLIETAEVYKSDYANYRESFSEGDLLRILNFLTKTMQELRFSQNHRLKTEVALCHLIGLEKTDTISRLLSGAALSDNDQTLKSNVNANRTQKSNPEYRSPAPPARPHNNSAPVVKEEPPEVNNPPKKNAAVPKAMSFEEVVTHWDNFINALSKENKMLLAPVIRTMKPIGFKSNTIEVEVGGEQEAEIFNINQKYFHKKTGEIFGSGIQMKVSASVNPAPGAKSSGNNSAADEKNPYVRVITGELGGTEVK